MQRRGLWAVVCVRVVGVGGCISVEQRAREEAYREQQYQARLASQCQAYGFQPGTPAFGQCMLQLDLADQQRRAAIGAAIIGSGMLNPRPVSPPQLPMPPPIKSPVQTQCYTDRFGYTQCTSR